MIRRKNPVQVLWPDEVTKKMVQAGWPSGFIVNALKRMWEGWDDVLKHYGVQLESIMASQQLEQKEPSIASLHAQQVLELARTEDLFVCHPEKHELESVSRPGAMPPSYDFAFALRGGNQRIVFPVEAKVVGAPQEVSEMCKDLTTKYLSGVGSPLSTVAALVGYLLSGSEAQTFACIEQYTSLTLERTKEFSEKSHRKSLSERRPTKLLEASGLECHWLICSLAKGHENC